MSSILPSGEEMQMTPSEILKYMNPDGVRQFMRQERLHLQLKPNKDVDFIDPQTQWKFSGELHNTGLYQRMEVRTFPDNGANPGYAGVNVDSGLFGIMHNIDKWSGGMSDEAIKASVNRIMIGAMATITGKKGAGLADDGTMSTETENRMAAIMLDPYDGRATLYSNDRTEYVNNTTRAADERMPDRTIARICDVPTHMTQLINDLDFVADPDYRHTDNNFTNSNRFIVDNLDDRTFVYPEIAKDSSGEYIENYRVGLSGEEVYGEADGENQINSQPDLGENPDLGDYGDRLGEKINSNGANQNFSGVVHPDSYMPGIFRSLEELERVDLVDQLRTPRTHRETPGAKRMNNYYLFDGQWSPNWFDRYLYNDSYLAQSMNPNNMEIWAKNMEPVPYAKLNQAQDDPYSTAKLYQWRYNRVSLKYYSKDISIEIIESGSEYQVGDVLRWTFGDDVFLFTVETVGAKGQIQSGSYRSERERIFEQDPSTHGIGVPFSNMSGVGHDAKLAVVSKVTIETIATQIKNNLYAYVDITPSVRSDNTSTWSDVHAPDSQGGVINVRSTAAAPAYSGINSGRGGPASNTRGGVNFHEHGGNATAGVHVHLFRYVIDTQNPTWVVRDGIQVFMGKWVDQGPMGVERPCDIKALLFSNPDTNNFNNYYKFMVDSLLDDMDRDPDAVATNNANSVSQAYLHFDQKDPESDQKFYDYRFDPDTCKYSEVDITNRVLYINSATGVMFAYNSTYKNDPTFGYGMRAPGWHAIAGATAR
jgi:hypothetical protein